MVADLTAAGVVQGFVWQTESPWLDSVRGSQPFWMLRSLAAVPLVAGFGGVVPGATDWADRA